MNPILDNVTSWQSVYKGYTYYISSHKAKPIFESNLGQCYVTTFCIKDYWDVSSPAICNIRIARLSGAIKRTVGCYAVIITTRNHGFIKIYAQQIFRRTHRQGFAFRRHSFMGSSQHRRICTQLSSAPSKQADRGRITHLHRKQEHLIQMPIQHKYDVISNQDSFVVTFVSV